MLQKHMSQNLSKINNVTIKMHFSQKYGFLCIRISYIFLMKSL